MNQRKASHYKRESSTGDKISVLEKWYGNAIKTLEARKGTLVTRWLNEKTDIMMKCLEMAASKDVMLAEQARLPAEKDVPHGDTWAMLENWKSMVADLYKACYWRTFTSVFYAFFKGSRMLFLSIRRCTTLCRRLIKPFMQFSTLVFARGWYIVFVKCPARRREYTAAQNLLTIRGPILVKRCLGCH